MPQTLLSLAALVAAAFFTLGQKQASTRTMQSIVRDEFEVAVAGALLQTTEFADSRSFDEATTPARLRLRLGLPPVLTQAVLDTLTIEDVMVPTGDFAAPNAFGRTPSGDRAICDPLHQLASIGCNDVSDFHDLTGSTWRDITLETPGGDPLPVEVRVVVQYVESGRPDVPVDFRTNHKRVDVYARSPVLERLYPGTDYTIRMNRVISFDPAVALEYLGRSTCIVGTGNAAQISRLQASVDAAQATANTARTRVTTTAASVVTAQATATQRAADATAAEARAVTATADEAAAAAGLATAQQNLADVQRQYDNAGWFAWLYSSALERARSAATAAQATYNSARSVATNARADATAAATASANAQTNLAAARTAAAAAVTAAADADRALAAAIAALQAFNGGCVG